MAGIKVERASFSVPYFTIEGVGECHELEDIYGIGSRVVLGEKENTYKISGGFPVSYLVSAPLSHRGAPFFWAAANWGGKLVALIDLLFHVCLWVSIVVIDSWIMVLPNRDADDALKHEIGDEFAKEIQFAASLCNYLFLGGLVLSLIFGWAGQMHGSAWPTQIVFTLGMGMASLLFTLLYALKLMMMTGDGVNGNWNIVKETPEVTVRQMTLWLVFLKVLAITMMKANKEFWGPALPGQLAQTCGLVKSGTDKGATTMKQAVAGSNGKIGYNPLGGP
jgi:hypothetical protein